MTNDEGLPAIRRLEDLEGRLGEARSYVRYSEGPAHDADGGSVDTESGLELPGLSVNPLDPEDWWTRPVADWLARQLCQYKHLRDSNRERRAWLVRGQVVGRGPDCEPLLADVEYVGLLDEALLDEAERRYRERFDAGEGPEGSEG
ncbi:hypothetical protein BCL57_000703 [Agromyces flavus]|uniref:Uncharacterized protein n=1 Tax=Agromyces flavus TaxID=589382 RepID=A0A1H1Y105_9MICO|nr:DUF6098 family protein [Agromyces flavus]MCP2366561.1 hypothetical protein [Agromyces flavus]GGI44920.1 hypothetical protein GCM10010932_07030 [Agromyces flavus]SDT15168.1 hypothetical protein SAMN04489721_2634 [Agromyces flavus]